MDWNVVAQYLPLFEKAAWLTLRLGLAGIALAIAIGLVCALVQYYKVPVLRRVVGFYIQLSRNTPLLVQLFFIYFANRLAEDLGVKVNYASTEAPTASSTCRPARSMSFWPTSRSRRSAPRRSILRCPT